MFPFFLIFIITAFFALMSFNTRLFSKNVFYAYCLCLGIFVGISDMLGGYDRYIYGEIFTSNAKAFARGEGFGNFAFQSYMKKEAGYGLINTLIGLITPNRYIFFLIYTLLMYFLLAECFSRYTKYPFFSLFLFMGLMFFFSFTYLRQVLAVFVFWLSLPYYRENKFLKFFAITTLAATIHNSAIIVCLIWFVPKKKYSFRKIAIVMFFFLVIGLIGVSQAFVIGGAISGSENIASHADSAEIGFRYEYVVESILFLYILYKNYNIVQTDKETLSYTNLYLFFCGILLLFCKSGDGGRIAWYGILGIIIMLTRFCEGIKGAPLRGFLLVMITILYARILFAWEFNMCPYKTFLTPGHTAEEWIYEKYEYDQNYDIDKFYNL